MEGGGCRERLSGVPAVCVDPDTGKRGPRVSLLGQNQSSTTFLQQEFGRVTKTSEPQPSFPVCETGTVTVPARAQC